MLAPIFLHTLLGGSPSGFSVPSLPSCNVSRPKRADTTPWSHICTQGEKGAHTSSFEVATGVENGSHGKRKSQ